MQNHAGIVAWEHFMNLLFFYSAAAATICALYYGLELTHQEPSLRRSSVKAISTLCLVWTSLALQAPVILIVALAFGAAGDFLISLRKDDAFLASLGTFSIVQLCLIALFWQHGMGLETVISGYGRLVPLIVLLAFCFYVIFRMWPGLGPVRWPVLGYSILTVTMGVAALTLPPEWPFFLAMIAAGLFILSDALIAVEMFVTPDIPGFSRTIERAIWFSYFAALVFVVGAFTL